MAISQEQIDTIIALWKYSEQQADPRSEEADIVSGLRHTVLLSCQYWIKGHSPICSHWSEDACQYLIQGEDVPSGYNSGNCDYLGRRSTCSKYVASTDENLEEYKCILPNMFLSGVGKASGDATTGLTLTPIPKENVKGYCDGDCDGAGRGTGCGGGASPDSPIICNYFRPWQMGFGSLEPRDVERTIKEDGSIQISAEAIEAAYQAVDTPMAYRLPLAFKIYNARSEYRKCAYWNDDYGARFGIDEYGFVELDADPEARCTCTDLLARQYCTIDTPPVGDVREWLLQAVWSQANTVVCNGAKPECPFYTGEWVYCNDLNMITGMRVTANQIFELRFWTSMWGSQEEYDEFFESKPNWQDVPTADIYTFKKWHQLGETPSDSIAEGQILHMCQPAPLNNRRFVPSTFLTAKNVQYTAVGINMGTTAPSEGQIYYPTLIRDPDLTITIWPIDIIYPYANLDSFLTEGCNREQKEPLGVKRGSSIDGDTISVIGITTRGKSVYVFNLNMLDSTLSEFSEHWTASTISSIKSAISEDEGNFSGLSPREKFFESLEDFIENIENTNPDNILTATSDSETGYFNVGPLNLKYGEINKIVICIKFTDTIWDFRIRPVLSKWYGGLIVQSSFSQQGTGENLPRRFTPNAEIEGNVYCLMDGAGAVEGSSTPAACGLGSIVHTASNEYLNTELSTSYLYSYCYKKITMNAVTVNNWASIGNSGLVWAELEDTNINYLFEWEIISAKMTYTAGEENEEAEEIVMTNVEIETFVSGKRSVPPSACILEPSDNSIKKMFLSGDWQLKVSYWYKEISNSDSASGDVEVLWPDFSNPNITFNPSALSIEVGTIVPGTTEIDFLIKEVDNQTVALMGLFNEEDGRIIAAMATKMLVQISLPECRNVEIDYRYSQPAEWFKLLPETNMSRLAIPPTKEESQGEYSPRYYRPFCGDHKNGQQGLGRGAMWYPFTTCEQFDFYQAFAGASFCTNWYQDCPRDDMRFCGPTKYTAFVAPGGGSAYADCVLGFHYRYSITTGDATFAGYANIVAYVNMAEYIAQTWSMPPFGNKGREMVNKWLSQDNWVHLSYKDTKRAYVKDQWVPMVPDNTDFFMSFNAFDEESVVSPDGFMHVNQLSFFKSNLLDETIGTERKSFDEVFGSRGIWRATYPPPLVTEGMIQKTIHYYFKDDSTAWAWREYWEDIEYPDNDREFYFLTYERPEYRYDYEKQEHRYICDESLYIIKYTAPVVVEGQMTQYPSLQLGDGPKRFFKIIYDTYEGNIEWADEGSGQVDGSTEEGEEQNIYEITSPNGPNGKWNHDENCLFDDTAVRTYTLAEAAGRKIETPDGMGGFSENYYNRGIIVSINRDNLKFLPYDEVSYDLPMTMVPSSNDSLGRGIYSWYNTSPVITIDLTTEEAGSCLSEVKLTGSWGLNKISIGGSITERSACIPGITIVENFGDGESRTLTTKDDVKFEKEVYGDIGIVDFTLTFKLQPTIDRMLSKPATSMEITLDCSSAQYIYLNFVNFKAATYADSSEIIQIYERKYITSTATGFGDHNIDGPKVGSNFVLQYELDMDNSGTYYAISPVFSYVPEGEIVAKDKMRAIYASRQYYEDIPIDIDINNIQSVEQDEQKELYNDAIGRDADGDSTTYTFVLPPSLQRFSENHNVNINIFAASLRFTTVKATWENHYLQNSYTSGELWYPQGHKYAWDNKIKRMRCYEIDYMPEYGTWNGLFTIFDVIFIHMDTYSGEIPVDPYTALYGNRMWYQLEVAQKLFGTDAGFQNAGRIMGTASSFIDNSNVTP